MSTAPQDTPDPQDARIGKEPFAYLSSPGRSYAGREPWIMLLLGGLCWVIGIGVLFLEPGAGGRSGIVTAAVFALLLGVVPLLIGTRRALWARRYRAVHHRSPWADPPPGSRERP